jgi:hypothetical protein
VRLARATASFALMVAGCCSHVDDYPEPSLRVDYETSSFSDTLIVIDANDDVWTRNASESGGDGTCAHPHGRITPEQRADFEGRVAAVASEATNVDCTYSPEDGFSGFSFRDGRSGFRGHYCHHTASEAASSIVVDVRALTR